MRGLAELWQLGFRLPRKKGRFLDISAAGDFGYSDRDELLEKNIADLVPDRGAWNRLLRQLDSLGAVSRFPLQVRHRQGELRSVRSARSSAPAPSPAPTASWRMSPSRSIAGRHGRSCSQTCKPYC